MAKTVFVQRDPEQFTAALQATVHYWLGVIAISISAILASGAVPVSSLWYRGMTAVAGVLGALGFRGVAAWQPPRVMATPEQKREIARVRNESGEFAVDPTTVQATPSSLLDTNTGVKR